MSKTLDMDRKDWDGACHCGTVRLQIRLSDGLRSARRCDCSYCRMRGAVAVSAARDDVEVISGADALALYRFNTGAAEHHFCSICGIYTHHRRRSNPDQCGVNVAILAGVSPFDFAEVPVKDGRNHPSDGGSDGIVGTLRFVPAR